MNEKKNNPFLEIIINIVIPSFILIKFSYKLGQLNSFFLALSFPFLYSIYNFFREKKFNFFSIIGFINILLTGSLGFLKLEGFWFAIKEATIPFIIGISVIISIKFNPIIKILIYNDSIINVEKVNNALEKRNNKSQFEKLIISTNYILASSFFLSSILNFLLALIILKSPPGTTEFNQELGKMNALSFPIIVLPSMVIIIFTFWKLINGIIKLTDLKLEEILKNK
ncbi:MAG: hypothetical protein KatS3mg002_1656 [Candidatus Woesearchaeota archaeon]|nr:MAG: hypothetical protein KatS3mg002_1656 [Candidatus Woesearchaeota archaeon]